MTVGLAMAQVRAALVSVGEGRYVEVDQPGSARDDKSDDGGDSRDDGSDSDEPPHESPSGGLPLKCFGRDVSIRMELGQVGELDAVLVAVDGDVDGLVGDGLGGFGVPWCERSLRSYFHDH